MKGLIHKKWLSIPVTVFLVLVLTAGAVLASGILVGPVTQTITQDINEAPPVYYTLTTSVNPARVGRVEVISLGGVHMTEPVRVIEGTVLNIVASSPDWKFVNWTGDTSDIADIEAASTTITMNSTHAIIANFVEFDYGSIVAPNLTLDPVEAGKSFNQTFVDAVTVVVGPDGADQYLCLTLDKISASSYTEYHYKLTGLDLSGEEIVLYVNNSVNYKSTDLGEAGTYTFTVDIWGTAGGAVGTAVVKVDITLENHD